MTDFAAALREQRWDDHRYYHHSTINQSLHLLSACAFVVAYVWLWVDPPVAALIAWLVSMVSRQAGHFFFEPKGYDHVNRATHAHKEAIKVGYNLERKVVLMALWALAPLLLWWQPALFGWAEPHADLADYVRRVGWVWLALGVGGAVDATSKDIVTAGEIVAQCSTGTTSVVPERRTDIHLSVGLSRCASPSPSRTKSMTNSSMALLGHVHVEASRSIWATSARPCVPAKTPVSIRVTPSSRVSESAFDLRWWTNT